MRLFLCFFLLLFSLILLTITRKKGIANLHSYVIPSRLCILIISWQHVGLVVKHRGKMSLKCRRRVGSALYQKMRIQKLYIMLKKIITKGMTYMQTETKSIRLFNAYESLQSLLVFIAHFLLVTRSQYFLFSAKN